MITATCIQKFKKNNKIYGYRLQDSQGNTKDVYADQLKTAIKTGQISIINLTLTSDNRLIDTTPTTQPQKPQAPQISEEQKVKNLIAKAKLLGLPLNEIPTACGHKCYLISKSDTDHIIYIPDNINILNENASYLAFTSHIRGFQGTIKVIGGNNLKDAKYMFNYCRVQYLDLSSFNTSKVTDMYRMFCDCKVQSLDLSSFDTSNVTNMNCMFASCGAQSINLSSFDTSNVTCMRGMFNYCQAQSLDLSSFDTSNVTDMMFMFDECKAQSLDLSSFDTSKVTTMEKMFQGCEAKSLDLSSFDTSNVTDMSYMFKGCQAQIKATDQKIIDQKTLEQTL